ncbi:tyrosine-type recombinase/integrase [Pseudomonas sp. 18175]|uniref:tyrosine-type recombinase/integrase n=1 Tax=Pseudomonas sp. 18175 TaxID=3390056 RepID=UPI003D1A6AB5
MPAWLTDPHGYAELVVMLREVLDGDSYQTVGRRHGLARSVVERRIKALVEHLIHSVGIQGLTLDSAAFVRRLREHRPALECALARTVAVECGEVSPVLNRQMLQQAIDQLRARSGHSAHDLALFYLLFTTGMRPLELARLTVSDCVNANGQLRTRSEVRAEVSHNAHVRPLYLTSPRLIAALTDYLRERVRRGHGLGEGDRYLGLAPDSPLFLNPYGQAYALQCSEVDGIAHHRCRGMQDALRKLFRLAGLPALSSRDARRTVTALLYECGADEAQVGVLLGIRDNSAVRALLPRPRPTLSDLTQRLL